MSLPIVTVNIVLRTATVSRAGFGTPLFIARHSNFPEAVRTYPSIEAVGDDFGASEPVYKAAQIAFATTPKPTKVKIGRRQVKETKLAIVDPDVGDRFTAFLMVDGIDFRYRLNANYDMPHTDPEDMADQIVADWDTTDPAALPTNFKSHFTITASDGVVTVRPTEGSVTLIRDITGFDVEAVSEETAGAVLDRIGEEDSDYYFVAADDHSIEFVEDLAQAVAARSKLYFTSTQDPAAYSTYRVGESQDIGAKLVEGGVSRTVVLYCQDADTLFPEMAYIAANAPFAPDEIAVVWDSIQLVNVPVGKNTKGGELTATQQLNLDRRNICYIATTGAGLRVIGGKTTDGEWIDNTHTLDTMTARVKEAQERLLLNQRGTKIGADEHGISKVEAALRASLYPFVVADSIQRYTINSERASVDFNTRKLTGMEFTAVLTGAILRVQIDGSLVNED